MNKPIKLSELMAQDEQKASWVAEGLIPAQGITILSGDPGSYKTWVLLEIARSVAEGESLFGKFPCPKGKVLLIDEENSSSMLRERLNMASVDYELDIHLLIKNGFRVDNPDHLSRLVAWIQENGISLVCIDSFVRIHEKEENVANQVAEVFAALGKIVSAGATVLMTHHLRKASGPHGANSDLRGSSDILAAVDCHLSVKVDKDSHLITFTQGKLRTSQELKPFSVEIAVNEEAQQIKFTCHDNVGPALSGQDIAVEKIKLLLAESDASRDDILKYLRKDPGLSTKKSDRLLKQLVQKKVLILKPGKHNKGRYALG